MTDAPVEPTQPAAALDAEPKRRRGWDVALTIVLMLVGVVTLGFLLILSYAIAVGIEGASKEALCDPASCSMSQVSVGQTLAFVLPILLTLASFVVAVVFLVRRKLAFWVVVVGIAASAIAWGLSASLVFSSGLFQEGATIFTTVLAPFFSA